MARDFAQYVADETCKAEDNRVNYGLGAFPLLKLVGKAEHPVDVAIDIC